MRRAPASRYPVASRWPLILGIVSVAASVVLAIITAVSSQLVPFSGGIRLPFADMATLPLSVGGYVLTPAFVFAALLWDRIAQRLGLRDRNFGLKPRYGQILSVLAFVGLALAVWHVSNIAYAVGAA